MDRRAFMADGSALLVGAMGMRAAAPDDEAAVKRLVAEYYDTSLIVGATSGSIARC